MPSPTNQEDINAVTARGFPRDAVSLEGLFKYRMENLNTRTDAHTAPGVFSPQCGFKGELVLRGGTCKVGLGWYNAVAGTTTPPPNNEIYQLVPPNPAAPPPAGLMCTDDGFCPLATMMTTQPGHTWTRVEYSADNIRRDPRYRGGLVGFALMGATSGSICSQNKFSQAELNTKRQGTNDPWVTVLVYQSTVDPKAYYLAFEDQPMTASSWRGAGGGANDGDFNDFVFLVTGVTCNGGGKPCKTELKGECADGITECRGAGDVTCKPITQGSDEKCDGLDNNCDGMIDEGDLCGANRVCDRGTCVGRCGNSEFPCAPGFECDRGFCKDPRCIGRDCPAGQVCAAGVCRGGCEGAMCPRGQICRIGRCFDPCAGVTCSAGLVCEDGACLPKCACRECGPGRSCADEGRCVDSGCERQTCNAPATVCVAGACQDACKGVTCPVGQECKTGHCEDVPPMPVGTGGIGVVVDAGVPPGHGGNGAGGGGGRVGVDAGTTSHGGSTGSDASGDGSGIAPMKISTCQCEVTTGRGTTFALAATMLAALWASRARRRPRRRAD